MELPQVDANEIASSLSQQIGQLTLTISVQNIQIQKLMAELAALKEKGE